MIILSRFRSWRPAPHVTSSVELLKAAEVMVVVAAAVAAAAVVTVARGMPAPPLWVRRDSQRSVGRLPALHLWT